MNRKIIYSLLIIISLFAIGGCSNNKISEKISNQKNTDEKEENIKDNNTKGDNKMENDEFVTNISVNINEKKYPLTLEDNATTRELFKKLPLNFNMQELNGNEKYIYMNDEYPINLSNPKHINKGDVMLYGNNCLVIFYKNFDTTYSYTKVGHIDNLEDLDSSSINVKFER